MNSIIKNQIINKVRSGVPIKQVAEVYGFSECQIQKLFPKPARVTTITKVEFKKEAKVEVTKDHRDPVDKAIETMVQQLSIIADSLTIITRQLEILNDVNSSL